MNARLLVLAIASASSLAGCAGAPACGAGQQAMSAQLLYFGTAMPGGSVTEADWRGFVDTVVTPRFPDGFTTWPASGQWRSAGGPVVREATHVLDVVHVPGVQADAAIAEIVAEYRSRFHQMSVLRVTTAACVAF